MFSCDYEPNKKTKQKLREVTERSSRNIIQLTVFGYGQKPVALQRSLIVRNIWTESLIYFKWRRDATSELMSPRWKGGEKSGGPTERCWFTGRRECNGAGVGSERRACIHWWVEKGKRRETPNHFNPSAVSVCEQEVERYPSEASERSEDLRKWRQRFLEEATGETEPPFIIRSPVSPRILRERTEFSSRGSRFLGQRGVWTTLSGFAPVSVESLRGGAHLFPDFM